jgi:hypothetical protein
LLGCAFSVCVISPKTAAILTVNGQCGTASLTWTLGKYGLFSHSRNLPNYHEINVLLYYISVSLYSPSQCTQLLSSLIFSIIYLFFRCNEQERRAESCTNCSATKLFSGLPTNARHTFQLSFFYLKKYWGFPKLRNRRSSPFLREVLYLF